MKKSTKAFVSGGLGIALLFIMISLHCSNNPMEPLNSFDAAGELASLGKEAAAAIYSSLDGRFELEFVVPSDWRKTSHGKQRLNGTDEYSEVYVYSPSDNYLPRITVISFSKGPGKEYTDAHAERGSLSREQKIKELYPERFIGRVERGYGLIGGISAPMVTYDMLDEAQQTTYRSREYTFVKGGKLCTIQLTQPLGSRDQADTGKILNTILASLEIKNQ